MRFIQKNTFVISICMLLVAVLTLSGCSAGGATSSGNTTTTTTSTATGIVASVTLAVGGTSITADGSSSIYVRATVLDTAGVAMNAKVVNFSTSAGTLSATSATTDASGIAQVTLTSPTITGSATLTASYAGAAASPVTVNFLPGAAATIGLNAQPSSVLPGGTTTLTIAAVDGNGNPVGAGQVINFSTVAAGAFSTLTGTTDADGRLSVTYTASTTAGVEALKAKAANGISGTANLTVASNIAVVGSIAVAPTLPVIAAGGGTSTLNATVLDTASQPIQGATVTFATTSGTLSSATATTNASGIASVVLTSGAFVQAAKITASTSGYVSTATVLFGAGAPAAIGLNPAPNSAVPGGQSTITAAVVDGNGNPVPGELLTFFFVQRGSGTPALSATSVATDVNGLASVNYTAGSSAGTDIVNAITSNSISAAGGSRATITVASNATVVHSIATTTNKTSIPVTTGTTQINATVLDSKSNPLAGVTVTFTASSGTLSTATATTDINGVATTTLTASASLLTSTVSATAGGYTSNVNVAFTAGAANTVSVSAAPTVINIAGTSTITALVVDASNNPVAGEPVTFAFTAKGSGLPTLGSTTATTSANGLAVASYTAGTVAGTDTLSATTSNAKAGSVSITSTATTTVVNGVVLTTGATTIPSGGALAGGTTVVIATVKDINGAAAAGVTVNFTTSAGTLSAASAVTNGTGVAQVMLTSSNNLGTATIVANASGFVAASSVTFTASNPSTITLLSGSNSLNSGETATLTAVVLDANGNPVSNETVTFTFTTNATGGNLAAVTVPTSVNGIASVVYTAGTTPGTDKVVATLTNGTTSSQVSLAVTAGLSASTLAITTSLNSVKSDNSTSATITVTATNANNVVVPGVIISFGSNGGTLNIPSAITNVTGQASVAVSSGSTDQTNRNITVTASTPGASSVTIPIQIVGSSVSLSSATTQLVSGASPTSTTLTVKAGNAGGVGVYNTPVSLAVTGSGNVTLAPTSGNTDVNGELAVTVTGLTSGKTTVTATALGATKTLDFTVSASGSEFIISAPVANPASLTTTTGTLPFTVQVGAAAISNIRLTTTIGTWTSCAGTGMNTSVCVVPIATPTATLSTSLAGVANVQVDGLDATGNVIVSDARKVAMTSAIAAFISLQSNVSVLLPSSGTTTNTATISATVRDSNSQPVGNSAVAFSLVNPTGGGETVTPALVLSSDGVASTDPVGQARATFTSGSLPTNGNGTSTSGVTIRGMVVGSGNGVCLNTESGSTNGGTAICGDTVINIGGTPGSIVIGQSSTLTTLSDTTYQETLSLLVADSNGNPVQGAVVSLSAWPVYFHTGIFSDRLNPPCAVVPWASFTNEDINQNLILDPGEDGNVTFIPGSWDGIDPSTYIDDKILTPQNSAAGTLPATVTTDSNGLASFNLTYLKQYAYWITTRITARTTVQGTESATSLTFRLLGTISDYQACYLPDSPYN